MKNLSNIDLDFKLINKYLETNCPKSFEEGYNLGESIRYSLLSAGKRIRPLLFLSIIRCDQQVDIKKYLSFAAGIESLHCYTLIHDDLPALDNDDYRRGKLSNHKKFGEATAILAGDALLTWAFELTSIKLPIKVDNQLLMINNLAIACGASNLILGQQIDLEVYKKKTQSKKLFKIINQKKTASLISASMDCAIIASGLTQYKKQISKLGNLIGLHFQITDDIIEFNEAKKNKTKLNSLNCIKSIGLNEVNKKKIQYKNKISSILNDLPVFFDNMKKMIHIIVNRN